jgi:hypothetical protein
MQQFDIVSFHLWVDRDIAENFQKWEEERCYMSISMACSYGTSPFPSASSRSIGIL